MSGTDAKMVDRAYWDPGVLAAAVNCGANAVAVYAWDHYIKDANGYCGGYTPEVVASIYAAGYDVHFVFVFRDGEAALDPAVCVAILSTLGAKQGAWVHNDIENGAMDSIAHDIAFNQAMRAAGYHPAPYGLASTLNLGYLQYADGAWVASYVASWNTPPPLVYVPYVGAWDYVGWQYSTDSPPPVTVDVSVHNFPPAAATAPAPTGGAPVKQPPFYVTPHADAHWFETPDGVDRGVINVNPGTALRVVQVANDGVNDWYRTDLGAWWVLAAKTDPAEPAPPPTPPTPAPAPDVAGVAAQLRVLAHQLDGN